MPVFKDNFNRDDGAIGPGWTWVEGDYDPYTDSIEPEIKSNRIALEHTDGREKETRAIFSNSLKPGFDQYAQYSVESSVTGDPSIAYTGIFLRYDPDTMSGYFLNRMKYTSGSVATTFTVLKQNGHTNFWVSTPNVYNYMLAEVFGPSDSTSIRTYGKNSVEDEWELIWSYDDRNDGIAGEYTGFYADVFRSNVYIDDFECGDYPRSEDQDESVGSLTRDLLYSGHSCVYSLSVSDGERSALFPMANFQVRKRATGNNYLQVSIPFAIHYADQLAAMTSGAMTLSGGVIVNGEPLMREIITANLNLVSEQRSPFSQTITISGYDLNPATTNESYSVWSAVYRATSDGVRRVRLAIFDFFINPGDTIIDDGSEMTVETYVASVSLENTQMEISGND